VCVFFYCCFDWLLLLLPRVLHFIFIEQDRPRPCTPSPQHAFSCPIERQKRHTDRVLFRQKKRIHDLTKFIPTPGAWDLNCLSRHLISEPMPVAAGCDTVRTSSFNNKLFKGLPIIKIKPALHLWPNVGFSLKINHLKS